MKGKVCCPGWAVVLLLAGGMMLLERDANAIPTFARKYGTSCTTCHSPLPIKLNTFGQAFRNNGYRMPSSDELFVKQPDQELGAPAWKEMWPADAVYPGAIPSQIPLSVQIYLDARRDPRDETKEKDAEKKPQIWFDVPHEVEVMTAGTAGKNVSWWANVEFKNPDTLEIVQAWGQLDNLFDQSLLNVRLGRFEPRFVPFSRTTQRFLANDFLPTEFAPRAGESITKEGKVDVKSRHHFKMMQSGIEVWGVKSIAATGGGLQYAVGLVNGGGPKVADEKNNAKDFYARLAYKYGGRGVGRGLKELSELDITGNWIDNSVRVGASVYQGKWGADEWSFSRLGFDLDAWFETVNLYGIVLIGSDDGYLADKKKASLDSSAWTVGADWIALPWVTALVRVEEAKQDLPEGGEKTIRRVIPACVLGIRPNVTWTAEYVRHLEVEGKVSGDNVARTRVRFIF